ncbi:MAG TPA: 50S ribosomal protein L29 [Terriglobales bacterium]|nr:50S ribosomal protein L29 [Terriglobales bacterium]
MATQAKSKAKSGSKAQAATKAKLAAEKKVPAAAAPAERRPAASSAFSGRRNKEAEKIRNLADNELDHRQRELSDQLFRLKFQLNMGQTESLKKIRGLRKDLARVKTIMRGRQLGLEPTGTANK